jgi:RNA polymerase sigma-70 factor (ECF subfamily)
MSNVPTGSSGRRPARVHLVPVPASPEPSDSALVRGVLEGAPLAPVRLWGRYSELVRRLLRRSLGPSVDVEDAVQETFLRLFRDLSSLRDSASLRSFLIGITLHVAYSELRRRRAKRWLMLSSDGQIPEHEWLTDVQHVEEREALHRLYRLLDRVDARRRLVFVLRYVEGLELSELSAVLGCSLATTKRRVSDAARRVSRLAAKDPILSSYLAGEP